MTLVSAASGSSSLTSGGLSLVLSLSLSRTLAVSLSLTHNISLSLSLSLRARMLPAPLYFTPPPPLPCTTTFSHRLSKFFSLRRASIGQTGPTWQTVIGRASKRTFPLVVFLRDALKDDAVHYPATLVMMCTLGLPCNVSHDDMTNLPCNISHDVMSHQHCSGLVFSFLSENSVSQIKVGY